MSDSDLIQIIVFPTIVIIVLFLGITWAVVRASKERILHKVQLAEIALNYQRELREAEAEVDEYLRASFSRELHDNIGHALTYMRLEMEHTKLDNPQWEPAFQKLDFLLQNATDQVRLLSRSMNADFLDRIGLRGAIEMECTRLKNYARIEIDFESGEKDLLLGQKDRELMAFRIFQEVVTNLVRHSEATKLTIRMHQPGRILYLEDNGIGFHLDEVLHSPKANGMLNIIRRSELAGFTCTLNSSPGKGFSLNLANKA